MEIFFGSNLKDCIVTVLGVVLADACSHPLHVGPLLLVLYLVDGVLQPAQPRSAVIILQQIFLWSHGNIFWTQLQMQNFEMFLLNTFVLS